MRNLFEHEKFTPGAAQHERSGNTPSQASAKPMGVFYKKK
jgi:hypothetical protein